MFIYDGPGDIFDFQLSDKDNNIYYYSILALTLQNAIKIAQTWYIEEFGHKATHLERFETGFPIIRNY